MTDQYKGQSLNKALAEFYDAAVKLLNEWERSEDDEIYLDDPQGKYPFADSFDDVCYKIGQWVEAVDEELKEEYPTERKSE